MDSLQLGRTLCPLLYLRKGLTRVGSIWRKDRRYTTGLDNPLGTRVNSTRQCATRRRRPGSGTCNPKPNRHSRDGREAIGGSKAGRQQLAFGRKSSELYVTNTRKDERPEILGRHAPLKRNRCLNGPAHASHVDWRAGMRRRRLNHAYSPARSIPGSGDQWGK